MPTNQRPKPRRTDGNLLPYNLHMLRLMVITAHPDDEAASFGGTLRTYADRGVETCVLCLTPGT
ncbi:MAG: PIG-L family deacetylase, partial [Acidobacteriales bacterium]|nr:PIG-L family deacetylase [Terriglobales bacterium]